MTADPARSAASAERATEERAVPPSPDDEVPVHRPHAEANPQGRRLLVLTLTALGVVYGDIGTSPLYALRECFGREHRLAPNVQNVYGVLSLIIWALTLVVTIKYIVFILRADNRGEGGTFALLALLLQRRHRKEDVRRRSVLIALALIGASLLYGEGIITPAVSVLGAMDGLRVAAPALERFVVPLAVIILFALFLFQKRGTAGIGFVFGPAMLLWFGTIATLGALEIVREPQILAAVNPLYAIRFFVEHGVAGYLVLGSVVLAITGAEALFADMGHFGKKPIRRAWLAVVFPALLLNYFGQGALILRDPSAAANPFYLLAPEWFLYPLIAIATMAAIVASQALISGAFSLTQQAVQLGYIPRVTIVHTSKQQAGQVYIPEVNTALMLGTLTLVVTFRSSTALAAAYGIAVMGTMVITSILFAVIARAHWNWPLRNVLALLVLFLSVDLAFLGANIVKVDDGGWVPLALALALFLIMTTWKRGREILGEITRRGSLPIDLFLTDIDRRKPPRVSGTAVFMTSEAEGAPVVLLHHWKHNKVLHDRVVLLSIHSAEVPEVPDEERLTVEDLSHGFYRVQAFYGFMEKPDVKEILRGLADHGIRAKTNVTTFYLGRERLLATGTSKMARWRKILFAFMSRNARSATEFFGIPPNRVVELGTQIEF